MRLRQPITPLLLLFAWLLSIIPAQASLKVAIASDSTAAYHAYKGNLHGWGMLLPSLFTDKVSWYNLSENGLSSRSFRDKGRQNALLKKRPDYVLLQFAHNDNKESLNRYTEPQTSFKDQLRQYLSEYQAIHTQLVLLTPPCIREFEASNIKLTYLEDYAQAIREIAEEHKVPLLDVLPQSRQYYQNTGEAVAAAHGPSAADRVHFNRVGARLHATLIAKAILENSDPRLKPLREQLNAAHVRRSFSLVEASNANYKAADNKGGG